MRDPNPLPTAGRGEPLYDRIGAGYSNLRRAEPSIAAAIREALGGARQVINLGAGAGSYEPTGITAAAVEPSPIMVRQRPDHLVPAVLATAEELPFADGSFDASLAVLTVHHWRDVARGLAEARRVTAGPVVVVTFDPEVATSWWLAEDYPELASGIMAPLPALTHLGRCLGGADVRVVPVPARCRDGFLNAYWNRPEELLDPRVRAATSFFAQLDPRTEDRFVARLGADLASGRWDERNGKLRRLSEFDAGLRILVSGSGASGSPRENRLVERHGSSGEQN